MMNLFHKKDQYQGYNIYSMKKYVDKKKNNFTTIIVTFNNYHIRFLLYIIVLIQL